MRAFLAAPARWRRFPEDVRFWLEMQALRSVLPRPGELLVETFPHEGAHYLVCYPFEGWNAHQSLGMLLSKRKGRAGLQLSLSQICVGIGDSTRTVRRSRALAIVGVSVWFALTAGR